MYLLISFIVCFVIFSIFNLLLHSNLLIYFEYHVGTVFFIPSYQSKISSASFIITSISSCPNGIAQGNEDSALLEIYNASKSQNSCGTLLSKYPSTIPVANNGAACAHHTIRLNLLVIVNASTNVRFHEQW